MFCALSCSHSLSTFAVLRGALGQKAETRKEVPVYVPSNLLPSHVHSVNMIGKNVQLRDLFDYIKYTSIRCSLLGQALLHFHLPSAAHGVPLLVSDQTCCEPVKQTCFDCDSL